MVPIRDLFKEKTGLYRIWFLFVMASVPGLLLGLFLTVFLPPVDEARGDQWSLRVRAATKNHTFEYRLHSKRGCRSLWQPGCCEPEFVVDHVMHRGSTERACEKLRAYVRGSSPSIPRLTPRQLAQDLYNYADPSLIREFRQQVGEELTYLEIRVTDSD